LVRPQWTNLNGLWQFEYIPSPTAEPKVSGREILVPFPPESMLSRVNQMTPEGNSLWYRRTFQKPKAAGRTILHFGASDWETTVSINGKEVGRHQGGYDPFSFDITDALSAEPTQEIVVVVTDPTDKGPQPRGKQVTRPGGIFYRPTSGIWQTVWLETVPQSYIRDVKITTAMDGRIDVRVDATGNQAEVGVEVYDGTKMVASGRIMPAANEEKLLQLKLNAPKLWAPETPFLYRVKVTLKADGAQDAVETYAGIREVYLKKNSQGQPVVYLNGKPVFLFGPLDQGFWPDGLYTAPTDDALKYDITITKGLGFNMIRKHVKVEPQRWYYWADKMGVLVIQDMPSGDRSIGPSDPDIVRTPESAAIYERELKAMMDNLHSHPSIISWVPFNEGWGQYDTARIADWTKKYDPSRLVNATTGWADRGVGDFMDIHAYPGPAAPKRESGRALLLGEFGGLGLVVPGHTWAKDGWGYQSYKSKEDLTRALEQNFQQLHILKDASGLSGAVYTQTTDVETELNGLYTYDRAMVKPDLARLKKAIAAVYTPSPKVTELVATSESTAATWSYTLTKPADGWSAPGFEAAGWLLGKGGFGTPETPGAVVGTPWNTSDIWLRREFTLESDVATKDLFLRIHHDDDVEVFIDGKLVLARPGWTSSYILLPWPGTEKTLKKGRHTLAVFCHQNRGGQFIDVGISRLSR
jgi:beta-galactosidase/beta-glucuronidase